MSIQGVTRYDQYLTNLSLAYPTGNLIGTMVAPIVSADNYSDYIYVDGDDAINQFNDEAEGVPASEVDSTAGTPYSYRSKRRALSETLLDKQANNQAKIVKGKQRITNKLTHRLNLKHELRVAAVLTDETKVTQYKDVDATPNARWDESTPVLETDIIIALNTIYNSTGVIANTIVIPYQAALYAANMSFIKDTLKYDFGMDVVTSKFQGQVMKTVGLPPIIKGLNVIISSGRKNDANKGETASVAAAWGKDCLIGYVPPSVGAEEMFGILTMEHESRRVETGRMTDPKGTKVLVEWDYDILEAELRTWYLLQNVIG